MNKPDLLKFNIGDEVQHIGDDVEDDRPGVVTGIIIRDGGYVYEVAWGRCGDSTHYGFELRRTGELSKT
jgi:hypothetical protein